jgi:hypothetical protein
VIPADKLAHRVQEGVSNRHLFAADIKSDLLETEPGMLNVHAGHSSRILWFD